MCKTNFQESINYDCETIEHCLKIFKDKGYGHMKEKEPIRKIFKNNSHNMYLINKFDTSKLCNKCEEVCSPYLKRISKNKR